MPHPRSVWRRGAPVVIGAALACALGAPPARAGGESIRVALPPGWHDEKPSPEYVQFGENTANVAFFNLIVEPRDAQPLG